MEIKTKIFDRQKSIHLGILAASNLGLYYKATAEVLTQVGSQTTTIDGQKVTYMMMSPEPLLTYDSCEPFIKCAIEYLKLMQTSGINFLKDTPPIVKFLRANGPRLEIHDEYKPNYPVLTRFDVVPTTNNKQWLVDTNVSPMGLADMMAIKALTEKGTLNFEPISQALKESNKCHGNKGLAIITHPNAPPTNSLKYLSTQLTAMGIKTELLAPADSKNSEHSVYWNKIRNLADFAPWLLTNDKIKIIDRPGIRAIETQALYALLNLPSIVNKFNFEFGGIPDTRIGKIVNGQVQICTDWQDDKPVMESVDLVTAFGFGPNEQQRLFIKTFDTSGSKGVTVSKPKDVVAKATSIGCGQKYFLIQRAYQPEPKGVKIEVYLHNIQLVAVGIMYNPRESWKIHGGSETVQSLATMQEI